MGKLTTDFIAAYDAETDQEKRLDMLAEFVNIFYDSEMDELLGLLERELQSCIASGNLDGEALLRFMLAYALMERGSTGKGMEHIEKVLSVFDRVTSHDVKAQVYNFLAFLESHKGNFDAAFGYVYKCISEGEQMKNTRNAYWGLYTLGVLYFDLKDLDNAEKYYREAAGHFERAGNHFGMARSWNGMASVCILREKFPEADALLQRALGYYRKIGATAGQSRCFNDLGLIYRKTGEPEKALESLRAALQIRRDSEHVQGIATSLIEIADTLIGQEQFEEALNCLDEAKVVCEKVGNRAKLYRVHLLFSKTYRSINEPWKALEHYDLYDKLKTEVMGETANNKIKELQTRMATEKSEKEAEIERLKNVELKNANLLISEKNKEILDSIRYAKRIQLSLMPTDRYIERVLNRALQKQTPA